MLSNDSAVGEFDTSYGDVWDVCIDRLESEGIEIYESKESAGLIKGERDKTRFVVKINSLAGDTQRLKVAVRKYFLPKPYVAQDLFLKIAKDLE